MVYNKLVRDKIPEIIEANDCECNIKYIEGEELKEALGAKLVEEVCEFLDAEMDIEELADIFEVIDAIIKFNNWSRKDVVKLQTDKRKRRGAFNKGIFLIDTDEEDRD